MAVPVAAEAFPAVAEAVDIPVADRVLRQVSEALGEGLYCDLFAMRDRLCARNSCFIMRATESIQHIFSELYHAPEICGQAISSSR
mgnify:CR=1 FL=1